VTEYKKHIVLLTSEFPPLPGGIGNHAYNLAEQLAQSGYRVSVIADQRDSKANETKFDSELKSKIYRVRLKSPRALMYLKRIWLAYKFSKSADILMCSGKFPLWVGAFLKSLHSIETIAIIHGTEVNFSDIRLRKSINKSLKRFDKVVAVSNFTKDLVADLELKSITVIPNGFSLSNQDVEADVSLQLEGHPKLLTVGNVTERKGQANVIKHLPKLVEQFPNIHYHCVGFNTETEQFQQLAESLGVAEHVTFHGHVNHAELNAFYKHSDICVMLSQTTKTGDVEGFGIALIEANHFGLPTIGATNCGIEDAISDGKSGILIKANDSEAFIKAITTILENKKHFQLHAQKWAEAHKWNNIITGYIDSIEE